MTARIIATLASAGLVLWLVGCTSVYPISIEASIPPTLDVSAFRRVLVAGFLAGGTDEVDLDLETVRLLRSQLRTRSDLVVIEAEVPDLTELVARRAAPSSTPQPAGGAPKIQGPSDLKPYEPFFADAAFWKQLGEEYQEPLIVTGAVLLMPEARSGIVERPREVFDEFGRRQVVPVRTYVDRRGFVLSATVVFIDGRTGAILSTEAFREEILYSADRIVPALAGYFELMDRLMPAILTSVSSQTVRTSRVLLK